MKYLLVLVLNNIDFLQDLDVLKNIRDILKNQSKRNDHSNLESLSEMNASDWMILSRIIDRICCFICFFITVIVTFSIVHE